MTWERYASDIYDIAKHSASDDRFTEQARAALIEWASTEGRQELAASKDAYTTLRRKLSELVKIPLRDSSRKKSQKKKEIIMSSSSADRSPFDDISQPARVPSGMSPRITMTEVNTAEPGPYYVFIPGIDAEGLKEMLHSLQYARIPAGEVFRIGAIEESMLAGRLDAAVPHRLITVMHPIEQKVVERLQVVATPASTTLNALKSDRSIVQHVMAHITAFDKIDVDYGVFNAMIRPTVKYPDGEVGAIRELTKPEEYRKEIESVGMLAMRLRWLQEAAEKLETGRMLEEHRRVIDKRPFLRDIWLGAIRDALIPSIDQFRTVAETRLSAIEDRMRNPQNSDNYDRYSFRLMWLLGRQPERQALGRTLNSMDRGGLSSDEIKTFVANEVARQGGALTPIAPIQAVVQQVQCDECGEMLNSVKGGYPRKCRYCGFEFRSTDEIGSMNAFRESVILPEESQIGTMTASGVAAAAELDQAAPLADPEITEEIAVEAASAGQGLSAEDEAELEDMAASILKG